MPERAGPDANATDRLELGRVRKPHGIRGEVVVQATTNRPERFEPGSEHFVGARRLVVDKARSYRGRWIVAYEGVDDRDQAEELRDALVTGEPIDVLAEGEMWVHELVGAEVIDQAGSRLGVIESVEVNPAHDLLVLDTGGLVPVVFVTGTAEGKVIVDPPPGLLGDEP